MMARIQISYDPSGRLTVSFPYDPLLVEKVKTIDGRRCNPVEKHWSFQNTEEILECHCEKRLPAVGRKRRGNLNTDCFAIARNDSIRN